MPLRPFVARFYILHTYVHISPQPHVLSSYSFMSLFPPIYSKSSTSHIHNHLPARVLKETYVLHRLYKNNESEAQRKPIYHTHSPYHPIPSHSQYPIPVSHVTQTRYPETPPSHTHAPDFGPPPNEPPTHDFISLKIYGKITTHALYKIAKLSSNPMGYSNGDIVRNMTTMAYSATAKK